MKILFIQDSALNESLALTELSGFLKSLGHDCALLLEREEKDLWGEAEKFSPDIFLIPCSLFAHKWAISIAKMIKSRFDKPVILSGTHPTFFPDILEKEECIDIICIGETELPVSELLSRMEISSDITTIKNLWVKIKGRVYKNEVESLVRDLGDLPLPDRELYYRYRFIRDLPMKRFSSGRGCCHSCAYCLEPLLREKYKYKVNYARKKSVDRVIEEILWIKDKFPLRSLHFSDDIFTFDKKWVIEFADKYRRQIGLPFTFNADADELDEEIISAVKGANCSGIAIGIETGSERIRNFIMDKGISNRDLIRIAGLIKKYKLKLITFNMLALPGESIEEAFETLRLNNKIKTDFIRLTIAFPMPMTRFTLYALKKGFIVNLDKNIDIYLQKFLKDPYPLFRSEFMDQFRNFYYLFRIGIKFPFMVPLIRLLIKAPPLAIFKVFNLVIAYDEKRIFKIGWLPGLRYFCHVGNPMKRTTTYPTLT